MNGYYMLFYMTKATSEAMETKERRSVLLATQEPSLQSAPLQCTSQSIATTERTGDIK
jgi:hypothetical protein